MLVLFGCIGINEVFLSFCFYPFLFNYLCSFVGNFLSSHTFTFGFYVLIDLITYLFRFLASQESTTRFKRLTYVICKLILFIYSFVYLCFWVRLYFQESIARCFRFTCAFVHLTGFSFYIPRAFS